jgi:chemotaxis protein histidine kinase CheA
MFAEEARRRTVRIEEGVDALRSAGPAKPAAVEAIEALREEAHALKGTAAVIGQDSLSRLGALVEESLVAARERGELDGGVADRISAGAAAYRAGAEAAAAGEGEPASVAASIKALTPGR